MDVTFQCIQKISQTNKGNILVNLKMSYININKIHLKKYIIKNISKIKKNIRQTRHLTFQY
jgi:hypothetical protein